MTATMRAVGDTHHHAHIIIQGPGHDGTTRVLKEGITTFGRLPSNDVILLGDLVSRHHSRITYFEGRATLQDLGSHNGSFVNGERVTTRVLKPGDKARVGNFQVVFHLGLPPGIPLQNTTTARHPSGVERGVAVTEPPDLRHSVLLNDLQAARAGANPSTRALRFVLRAADALAKATDLPTYMDEMLALALEQTEAQVGVYLRTTGPGEAEVVVARTPEGPIDRPHVSMSVVRWVISKAFPVKSGNLADDVRFADSPSRVAGSLSVLCVPLGSEEGADGAIYLSRATPAFSDGELDALGAVAHLVNSGLVRWAGGPRPVHDADLGRLFSEGGAIQVQMRLDSAAGSLQPIDAAVLRAGLVGAGSAASHSRNRGEHTHFYDAWCEAVLSVVHPLGAEATFGPGATLCAVFGPGTSPPGQRALEAALRLRDTTDALVGRHGEVAGCRLRAGIDQGRVLLGAVGGPHRVAWTAIGDPVELAGRLEAAGAGGTILITDRLRSLAAPRYTLRPRGQQKLRGHAEPLTVLEIVGRAGPL